MLIISLKKHQIIIDRHLSNTKTEFISIKHHQYSC